MTFTANGKRILTAVISEPLNGAWVADLEVEATEDLGSSITIDFGSAAAKFIGTTVRGGIYQGRWVGRVVGGAGKLSIDVESRYYDSVPAKTVLAGLMSDSGETLDGTVASSVLGHALPRWLRPVGPPCLALDDLANELGVTWRVTRAGRIWLGTEKWPDLTMTAPEITQGPSAGTVSVAPADAPLVRPGVTFNGKHVSRVVTTLQGGKLRQTVWQDEATADRLLASLAAIVRRVLGKRLEYLGSYLATVVRQSGDGLTVEVVPDDTEVRGAGLTRVPIRHGSPGWGVRVPSGTRVTLRFDGGDPSRPYVADWEPGAFTEIKIGNGTLDAARRGDMVFVTLTEVDITYLCTLILANIATGIITPTPTITAQLLAKPMVARGCISSGRSAVKI